MGLIRSVTQYLGVFAKNPPELIEAERAPTANDKNYRPGSLWLNKSAATSYQWPGSGSWIPLGGDVVAVATINTQAPIAGNYTLAGTASQITKTDTAGTTTFSLPSAITAPGSLTTTTTLTAGTDITATLGHVIINGAAKQLRVHGGAVTDFIGQATLTAGVATVLNTNIAAGDKVVVSRRGINGSTALGVFDVTVSAGVSFVITARKPADATTETNDISIVDYFIVRQV